MKYLIKKGDTLSAIGRRFNLSVDYIMAANPQIKDPNKIYAGDTIRIPVWVPLWRRITGSIFE